MERRQHKRLPCRIPCDIHLGKKKTIAGFVQDVSAGGLSVRADVDVDEEETFAVTLKVAPRSLVLDCMVWHARPVRRPSSGESFTQLGLVLTSPSDGFLDLLARLEKRVPKGKKAPIARPEPARPRVPRPESTATPVIEPDTPTPIEEAPRAVSHSFTIRVKQDGGPRSRRLVVGGSDAKDAEARALAEIGAGWTILDVKPA